ncbi:MAG: peptide ABC transporter substrate-binding protein [Sphaerochaetaceae bacterium]|nr:peptide ABC transporter substrate-binding protein [Sphaerochaetaceae bacterium]
MESGKKKHLRWLGCLLILTSLAFPAFAKGSDETPVVQISPSRQLDRSKTLVVAIDPGDDPIMLDPRFATDSNSAFVASNLAEGLCDYDPETALPVPALAESWVVSEDGLTWEFQLRDAILFSDGSPITATDFIESWLSLVNADLDRTSFASQLDIIEGVEAWRTGQGPRRNIGLEAVNDQLLRITLRSPAPYLPMLLCNVSFSVVHKAVRDSVIGAGMVTSGPYVLQEATETRLILVRNEFYWSEKLPKCDYLEIDCRGATAEVYADYKNGNIHWAQMFIPRAYQVGDDLYFSPQYSTSFFYFSAVSGPYANPDVRKALYALVDWDAIRKAGSQPFLTESLVPGSKAKVEPLPDSGDDRKAIAFSLLEKSGYPQGQGLPPLIMAVHRGSQVASAAERIADTWSSELSLTVILDTVPLSIYVNHPEQSPYHFACVTWIGDYYDPSAFLTMWMSDSTFNLANYADPTYDGLIHGAFTSMSPKVRERLLLSAEEYLLDERAAIPTSNSFSINFVRADLIDGWYDNMLNVHPMKYIGLK